MRMASSRQAAAGSVSARETPVVEACQVLTSLVGEDADRKPVFLAEGGVIALMELLEERSTKVSNLSFVMSICHEHCVQEAVPKCVVVQKHSWNRLFCLQLAS